MQRITRKCEKHEKMDVHIEEIRGKKMGVLSAFMSLFGKTNEEKVQQMSIMISPFSLEDRTIECVRKQKTNPLVRNVDDIYYTVSTNCNATNRLIRDYAK